MDNSGRWWVLLAADGGSGHGVFQMVWCGVVTDGVCLVCVCVVMVVRDRRKKHQFKSTMVDG